MNPRCTVHHVRLSCVQVARCWILLCSRRRRSYVLWSTKFRSALLLPPPPRISADVKVLDGARTACVAWRCSGFDIKHESARRSYQPKERPILAGFGEPWDPRLRASSLGYCRCVLFLCARGKFAPVLVVSSLIGASFDVLRAVRNLEFVALGYRDVDVHGREEDEQ